MTDDFPQKAKGYIEAPAFASGKQLTFGWDVNQVISGSTTLIPFSQSNAWECTISFNTLTFEASPFTSLLFNGEEMSMVDNDNYKCGRHADAGRGARGFGHSRFRDVGCRPGLLRAGVTRHGPRC